jgi:hypothetical protein
VGSATTSKASGHPPVKADGHFQEPLPVGCPCLVDGFREQQEAAGGCLGNATQRLASWGLRPSLLSVEGNCPEGPGDDTPKRSGVFWKKTIVQFKYQLVKEIWGRRGNGGMLPGKESDQII